jgi:hypothetical protein
METGEIISLGNGLSTLSGGTRTEVKPARPWQAKLQYPESGKCPLCNKNGDGQFVPGPGWKSLQNAFTPHLSHRILIPDICWTEGRLRSLGGAETLTLAWKYALSEAKRTRGEKLFPLWIFSHVGCGSGQNYPHHHWHILEPILQPNHLFKDSWAYGQFLEQTRKTTIAESDNFVSALWGIKAGQVFTVAKCGQAVKALGLFSSGELLRELAEQAHGIVQLFNEKFRWPDFCLMLDLSYDNDWCVIYTPILNNWGGPEFIAPYRGTPHTLPWPHEKTLKFLKG